MKPLMLFPFFLLVIASCTKNDAPAVTNVSTQQYATLRVTVINQYTNSKNYPTDSPMTKSTVTLYGNLNDYLNQQNMVTSSGCNDSGMVTFSSLPQNMYYVVATHPTLGRQEQQVSTPLNAVTNLQMAF